MFIHLRPFQSGDEEAAVRWSRDAAFCEANEWTPGLPPETVREWWCERSVTSPHLRMIEMAGEVIGYAEWQDLQGSEAELGIAIGDSAAWGRGIGAQAGRLMLAWAFSELGLESVWAEVHAPNLRSLALMRKIGFRELGPQGEADYQGQQVPMIRFELRREYWQP